MSNAEVFGPDESGPQNAKDANYSGTNGGNSAGPTGQARPFPWERLAFTVLFAVVAWFVFWLSLILALVAGGLRLFGVETKENFATYARRSADYLALTLSYVSGATDEKPFPFG